MQVVAGQPFRRLGVGVYQETRVVGVGVEVPSQAKVEEVVVLTCQVMVEGVVVPACQVMVEGEVVQACLVGVEGAEGVEVLASLVKEVVEEWLHGLVKGEGVGELEWLHDLVEEVVEVGGSLHSGQEVEGQVVEGGNQVLAQEQ